MDTPSYHQAALNLLKLGQGSSILTSVCHAQRRLIFHPPSELVWLDLVGQLARALFISLHSAKAGPPGPQWVASPSPPVIAS